VEALSELDSAGISELTDVLDLPTSNVSDHVRTLERKEFVVTDRNSYHIDSRFLELGGFTLEEDDQVSIEAENIRSLKPCKVAVRDYTRAKIPRNGSVPGNAGFGRLSSQ